MEKRKSERVQFFQMDTGKDIQPIWVFRQIYPEATLGLLLDIGTNGAQVLTSKSEQLAGKSYRLIVQAGETDEKEALAVNVRCCWSRQDGTLYTSNGLIFDKPSSIQEVLAASDAGTRWFRCEMLPL